MSNCLGFCNYPSFKTILRTVKFIAIILLAFLGVLVVSSFISYLVMTNFSNSTEISNTFSISNTVFTGLAFCGLIYANYLQRNALELQEKQIQENKKEVTESINQLKKQTKINQISSKLAALPILINEENKSIKEALEAEDMFENISSPFNRSDINKRKEEVINYSLNNITMLIENLTNKRNFKNCNNELDRMHINAIDILILRLQNLHKYKSELTTLYNQL